MQSGALKKIVIVGGGTSGWLTAGLLAAEHMAASDSGVQVTLVESPDVKTIGVGEGTWPTMRATLKKIGVSETDFLRECDASFKQGAKFARWVTGDVDDYYYHPLVLPHAYQTTNLAPQWLNQGQQSFEDSICFQGFLCEHGLAPKQHTTPEYAHVANYAYHLDAGKFTQFLQRHCVNKLGVTHILDHVSGIKGERDNDIEGVYTQQNGLIEGDLFIDCTGFKSLLLGEHYQIPFKECESVLFNNTALAVQVPYPEDNTNIASHTISTAQQAGWIWDIGLPTRRGVGYVFSANHTTVAKAEDELSTYLHRINPDFAKVAEPRKIDITPGHRSHFWHKNCVAVGLSAGFLEPLEASALVLIELAATMIADQLPADKAVMAIVAKRFNKSFQYRWQRIIDFLKLHYVLTKRTDSDYWIDNCRPESIPDSLQECLTLWRHQSPYHFDFTQADEVFPSASYQYVLYGMGFKTQHRATVKRSDSNIQLYHQYRMENENLKQKLKRGLPSNRELLEQIYQNRLQKI